MAEDSFVFLIKTSTWRGILERFPKGQLRREAQIQIDKLERMAHQFNRKFPPTMLLAMPEKQLRKAKGPDMHRIVQQSKKVDKVLTRLLTETLVNDLPELNLQVRRKMPALSQRFVEKMNRNIHQGMMEITKNLKGLEQAALKQ